MENVRSCTQKMFAVRLLGSSVSAALAVLTGVGALVPSAVRAAQMETEPIRESRDFADDTVVDVSSAHVTLSPPPRAAPRRFTLQKGISSSCATQGMTMRTERPTGVRDTSSTPPRANV